MSHARNRKKKTISRLRGNPQKKAVCLRVLTISPKKPNSANRRVLVTHSDGTQSVEEIKNDLGIKADDDDEMVRRLKGQGVDVSGISKFGGGDDGIDEGPKPKSTSAPASAFTTPWSGLT